MTALGLLSIHREAAGTCALCGGEWPCRDRLLYELASTGETLVRLHESVKELFEVAGEDLSRWEGAVERLRISYNAVIAWAADRREELRT